MNVPRFVTPFQGFKLVAMFPPALPKAVMLRPLTGQNQKDDAKKYDLPAELIGRLPNYWPEIGLTDEQKQTIYKIQAKNRDRVTEGQAQGDTTLKAIVLGNDKEKDDWGIQYPHSGFPVQFHNKLYLIHDPSVSQS